MLDTSELTTSGVDEAEEIKETAGEDRVKSEFSASEQKFPITSLGDILSESVIEAHLNRLDESKIRQLYGALLPEGIEPTKENVMRIVRSGFFHQATSELSSLIGESGVGQILASSLGYEYEGEGIDAFLRGIRRSGKKHDK